MVRWLRKKPYIGLITHRRFELRTRQLWENAIHGTSCILIHCGKKENSPNVRMKNVSLPATFTFLNQGPTCIVWVVSPLLFSHSGQLTYGHLVNVCFCWSSATHWLSLHLYLQTGDKTDYCPVWEWRKVVENRSSVDAGYCRQWNQEWIFQDSDIAIHDITVRIKCTVQGGLKYSKLNMYNILQFASSSQAIYMSVNFSLGL